jgi:hypothetical protein
MRPTPPKDDAPAPQAPPAGAAWRSLGILAITLAIVLAFLFRDSFSPDLAMFANDGPLGAMMAECFQLPGAWKGIWADLNWTGVTGGVAPLDLTWILNWLLGPRAFINFYPALAILTLGLCAWIFFRQLGFPPAVCVLGGLAAGLNSDFFSYACWGLGTLTLCVASVLLALAALISPLRPAWARPVLAGAALGSALMEGFDNGAIFSLYVAAFAVFHAWNTEPSDARPSPAVRRLATGAVRTAIVAATSALVAAHMLIGLVQGNITGAAGMGQDRESREARWWFATMWSLPPKETLRAVIPGLYGYRMDSPDGANYWGTAGSTPAWDAYFATPNRNPAQAPRESIRFSGAGHYTGILVVLLAAFAVVQSARGETGPLRRVERRWVWFWLTAAILSLLFAFGRYAPFYRLIYALPYFNTIRIPMKFLHPMNLSLVVLCGYGLHALWRGWISHPHTRTPSPSKSPAPTPAFAHPADRAWVIGTAALTVVALVAWMVYGNARNQLLAFLAEVGFEAPEAAAIARFSHREVGLFVIFLALSSATLAAIITRRLPAAFTPARSAAIALGSLLVIDLARANTPWVMHYNWRERFTSNPVFDILRAAPHSARVSGQMPFALQGRAGQLLGFLSSLYGVEWLQHQFRYFNIQALEVVQMPRKPADLDAYERAVKPNPIRDWELSNTRFLLGLAPLVDAMNQQLDPDRKRFRLHTAFNLSQNPGGSFQVVTNTEGPFALIEFTGALPRAMLFDRWRGNVDDSEALQSLANPAFSPHSEVLIAGSVPDPAVTTASQPAGSATYESYSSKRFVINTDARTPCVLLVNDKHDPDWTVLVDGKPEPLLRANFIMRGVYLPPGQHRVEFRFEPSTRTLWFSATMMAAALALLGYTTLPSRHQPRHQPPPA